MKRPVLILNFLWFFLACAHGQGIAVRVLGEGQVTGRPGEVVTVVLSIENQAGEELRLTPQWALPQGWLAISDELPFSLAAGASTLKLLSVHVAPSAAAGSFEGRYEAVASKRQGLVGTAAILFEVAELKQVLLTPANIPEYVEAGKPIAGNFLLQNLGNSPQLFNITTQNCELEGESQYQLEPNESVVLTVRAKTLSTIRRSSRVALKIYAGIGGAEEPLAYAFSFVKVVPRVSSEIEEGQRLPVSLRLSHLTHQWADGRLVTGFQGELYANGSLDEAGEQQFEIKLRGPNRFGLSQLGQYDEYFARFEDKKNYAFLGDKTFALTPLTEFARYARGAEAARAVGKYSFGALYYQPRFFPELSEAGAAYARYHFDENNQLGVNLLRKVYAREQGEAVLASLHGNFQPFDHTTVEGELSHGTRAGSSGNGLLLRVNSTPVPRLQLSSSFIFAEKNYPGYYNNTTSFNGQASFQASSWLNLSLNFNQDERNASRDTLFAISPYSKFLQGGAAFKLGKKGLWLRGYLRQNEIKDRMPSLKFHYTEEIIRLQFVKEWPHLNATFTQELGRRENHLLPTGENRSNTHRAFLNLGYNPSKRHFVQGFVQRYQYDYADGHQSRQWIAGAGMTSQLLPFTRLQWSFQTNYLPEEYFRNRNLFYFQFSQQVGKRKNHELSILSNYVLLQRTQQDKDFSLQLNYTWNLGLRTERNLPSQGVIGQILNKGVETVGGIVLYLNGQTAVTAPDGSFSFKHLPPGSYYLLLDPSSIELHSITDVPLPMVVVAPGVDASVSFGLTKSVSLTGTVDIEPEKKPTKNNGDIERPKVFMFEITNGEETFRRMADENHRIEFPDIRPGKWTLRVLNPESYRGFYFDRTQWELELQPEMVKNLDIKLFRKRKEIKFQDKLSLTSAGG